MEQLAPCLLITGLFQALTTRMRCSCVRAGTCLAWVLLMGCICGRSWVLTRAPWRARSWRHASTWWQQAVKMCIRVSAAGAAAGPLPVPLLSLLQQHPNALLIKANALLFKANTFSTKGTLLEVRVPWTTCQQAVWQKGG